jgi:uncharacterized membrane protein
MTPLESLRQWEIHSVGLAVCIAALFFAHVFFFTLEALCWGDGLKLRVDLGFSGVPEREAVVFAKNQGFSNLCLAVGVVLGGFLFFNEYGYGQAGRVLLAFLSVCIGAAGLVGFWTVRPPALLGKLGFLVGQTGFGLATLWLLVTYARG